jgi:DNA-binding response OmpR family regulator
MSESPTSIRLLLVDDEEEFRRATVPTLSRRGFTVAEAADGEQAISAVRKQRPDVVLLDLKMPGLSGIETLKKIRALAPALPVIILTGHGSYDDALAGIRLDIVDFLQKPMNVEELARKIHDLLHRGAQASLQERTIRELMVSPERYHRLHDDDPVERALEILAGSVHGRTTGEGKEAHLRSVLIFDRQERFVNILRFSALLRLVLPDYLENSPYSSYFTGMFLAQCKVIRKRSIADILGARHAVDVNAPLMQAVHMMSQYRLVNLPVMDQKKLVGVLREKDIILEIGRNVGLQM